MARSGSSGARLVMVPLLGVGLLLAACGGGSANGGTGGTGGAKTAGGCATGAAAKDTQVTVAAEPDSGVAKPDGACWASISATPMTVADVGAQPDGTSSAFKVAWSAKDLYIQVYTQEWPLNNLGGANWWQSDGTEYDISGEDTHAGAFNDANTFQLAVTSDGVLQTSGENGTAADPAPTPVVKVVDSKGFYTELVVPWATLGVTAPAKGQKYQFDVGEDYGDDTGARVAQMVWQCDPSLASTTDWHNNTDQWGDITLG